uniref:Uncharacterized protein n=1 Tax=Bionectria ochroleuca TaxID=29856 RepID=A0A8H7NAT2_BIOOC
MVRIRHLRPSRDGYVVGMEHVPGRRSVLLLPTSKRSLVPDQLPIRHPGSVDNDKPRSHAPPLPDPEGRLLPVPHKHRPRHQHLRLRPPHSLDRRLRQRRPPPVPLLPPPHSRRDRLRDRLHPEWRFRLRRQLRPPRVHAGPHGRPGPRRCPARTHPGRHRPRLPPTSDEAKNGNTDAATDGQFAAFFYFLAAVLVSLVTLIAFAPLVRRHNQIIVGSRMADSTASIEDAERASRKSVSLWHLFRKLHWLSLALGITFAEAMFFPVFTVKITSVVPIDNAGALFRPAAFIPLAFFFWNLGDLSGRVATIIPFPLKKRPFVLFILSLARSGFIPLYFLCNIGGRGAVISSDFFYLFIVQFCFGLTNGWMGSTCMMASGDWIEDEEREAAGGFMGLCIVIGLTMGSLLSFSVASI